MAFFRGAPGAWTRICARLEITLVADETAARLEEGRLLGERARARVSKRALRAVLGVEWADHRSGGYAAAKRAVRAAFDAELRRLTPLQAADPDGADPPCGPPSITRSG